MFKGLRGLGIGILGRRLLTEVRGIREQLTIQNQLLARMADHFAPALPAEDRATVKADTGVSYLDPIELGLASDYVARTHNQTGRDPTEEEVLIYLADEKTVDLHARLLTREHELEAMHADRRGR